MLASTQNGKIEFSDRFDKYSSKEISIPLEVYDGRLPWVGRLLNLIVCHSLEMDYHLFGDLKLPLLRSSHQ